ncbi:uncharacterized protein LTHEOB_11144 [Lasiodiplodia theobromae]|uniref:uncharacterized protein n=1 Tax=Lasiodiplodia theobromae TaxID=45133 RepID=UPI0015C396B1|nr:uncharacterized protein LTHEOB_11144 [Lasiodiplodia theobromae]KAF4538019.1 hypothetical protein LTHEOB_11144 [Lasiodiplodia theobromae]
MESLSDTTTNPLPPPRAHTPPPAYTPSPSHQHQQQRCYHTRPGSTQPSAYVPRGHPRSSTTSLIHHQHHRVSAAAAANEKEVLFYKPAGHDAEPAPAYSEGEDDYYDYDDDDDGEGARERRGRGEEGGVACYSPSQHQHRRTSKLEARIRALEAQLAARGGK